MGIEPNMNNISETDSDPKAIGHILRIWRAERAMTQKDVAEKLGISAQQFQKYESGASGIELSRLFEICRIFGKAPSELLNTGKPVQKHWSLPEGTVTEYTQMTSDRSHMIFAKNDADSATQVDISFQISEVVSQFLAIKLPEDKAMAIQILRAIAQK